ncbi:MAG TPA: SUF system NifU family Fe-S cluster assembly protein [Candidatus Saccharimonadia bacterium]|nr:SUF system NifU family Fe-S cluster assembly protein [Candidatus Saccharimonadia bacterium]
MDDLYQETILDHVRTPRNYGTLAHPTHHSHDTNASCGDAIELQVSVKNGKIAEVAWSGSGCAISSASASMLSEMLLGKTLEEAKTIDEDMILDEMGLTEILPTREKCLRLPIRALTKLEEN